MLKKKLKPLIITGHSKRRFKKIVFVDRDGVINRFPGMGAYVTRLRDLKFIPGSIQAIKLLTEAGFEVNVVSNQGCVSRGLITLTGLRQLTRYMMNKIKKNGGKINSVFYCVHQLSDECRCKKPNVTLFKKALRGRRFRLSEVFFIGDSKEDMQAARNLQCKGLLVLSGRTKKKDLKLFKPKPDKVKINLLEAAQWILRKRS